MDAPQTQQQAAPTQSVPSDTSVTAQTGPAPITPAAATQAAEKTLRKKGPAHDPTKLLARVSKVESEAQATGNPSLIQSAKTAKETSLRLSAARVPLTQTQHDLDAAKSSAQPLNDDLAARLSSAAKHLRLSPSGKNLLLRAGLRTPFKRASMMLPELRNNGLEVPLSVMADLESTYHSVQQAQARLTEAKAANARSIANYQAEAKLLKKQLSALWGNMIAARCSAQT